MTKNAEIRNYGKVCTISGKSFPANYENFYCNNNSNDGLHPYHKSFDNFRRTTGATVDKVRELINLINN
tara:strand:+ start:190 stop:396 length:207 start_codon:yes stop_codon:yes gene_type:complete